jgi:3-deoxy-D-manno-octulosonate 8-phosphate phosphatase (KDO 8-P phosphatase)
MINYELKKIKAIVLDVDGVLSRTTIGMDKEGEPSRTVNTKDGYALQYAVKQGLKIAIITGARTPAIKMRYNRLGINDVFIGAQTKIEIFNKWCLDNKLQHDEIIYMGDDIPDYEIMNIVGCPCCPSDAVNEIKEISLYISHAAGGEGCVRDVVETVMRAQGKWMNDKQAFGW